MGTSPVEFVGHQVLVLYVRSQTRDSLLWKGKGRMDMEEFQTTPGPSDHPLSLPVGPLMSSVAVVQLSGVTLGLE